MSTCAVAVDRSLDCITPNVAPSEVVRSPDKVADLLGDDKSLIHLSGAPAALFNPALATLQRNLENLEQVEISPSDIGHAAQYLRCAIKFYKDDAQRQDAIMELIEEGTGKWRMGSYSCLGGQDQTRRLLVVQAVSLPGSRAEEHAGPLGGCASSGCY